MGEWRKEREVSKWVHQCESIVRVVFAAVCPLLPQSTESALTNVANPALASNSFQV